MKLNNNSEDDDYEAVVIFMNIFGIDVCLGTEITKRQETKDDKYDVFS